MLHILYKNAYSSLCKLNICFFLLKLQKWFSQEQWEIFFLLLFGWHEWQRTGILDCCHFKSYLDAKYKKRNILLHMFFFLAFGFH